MLCSWLTATSADKMLALTVLPEVCNNQDVVSLAVAMPQPRI